MESTLDDDSLQNQILVVFKLSLRDIRTCRQIGGMAQLMEFWLAPPTKDASPLSCNATVLAISFLYGVAYNVLYKFNVLQPCTTNPLALKDKLEWPAKLLSTFSALAIIAGTPCTSFAIP